ncbi:MAG: FAD-binding oxidoreductase [Actinomycetia bacterium]|nr:FAD-binding oxidoreductase [bacterium]MBU4509493.1 FAD-binding oxidoreductase [bacterium]MCG2791907.1 FAD-binding oxidoreductase [Actinomycetes bacterium]
MDKKTCVIVIGGGYFGSSIAYHLAARNVRTTLIEKGELGDGSSGANFGNIQVQDAEAGISLQMALESFSLWKEMKKLLDMDIEYKSHGSLILAISQEEWDYLREIQSLKLKQGLKVSFLNSSQIKNIEPCLSTDYVYGASFNVEASINPFKLIFALARRARDMGAAIMENTNVEDFIIEQNEIKGVVTNRGQIQSDIVILTTGAWTKQICKRLNLNIPIGYVYAEASVTEALSPLLNNSISLASFFTEVHGKKDSVISLCCTQTLSGNILIGETTHPSNSEKILNGKLRKSSNNHFSRIPIEIKKYFPKLILCKVIRSWRVASPYTKQNKPVFGFIGPKGLFIAAGFKSAVIMLPIVGQIVADIITKGKSSYDLNNISII